VKLIGPTTNRNGVNIANLDAARLDKVRTCPAPLMIHDNGEPPGIYLLMTIADRNGIGQKIRQPTIRIPVSINPALILRFVPLPRRIVSVDVVKINPCTITHYLPPIVKV
jgi:hypothetical protein